MDLIFGNPMGFWALLGIPAVLLIHLLQHEARRYRTSTLFLLEHLANESREGRVVERIRNSAALWLQLLAVLLVTWLLVQPRWVREDSFQRVVVVLDSSVSMTAFLDRLPGALASALADRADASARTEWRLIETDPRQESLYAGERVESLVERVRAWRPRLGTHAFAPAYQVARSLAGAQGTILLVSDRRPDALPDGIELLAIGSPLDNVGFTGLRVETDAETNELSWQAMVRNAGSTPQRRRWYVAVEDARREAGVLTLDPGETRRLRGTYPANRGALALELEADGFPVDDRLPMVRPRRKRLSLARRTDPALDDIVDRIVGSLERIDPVRRSGNPDLEILSYDPGVVPAMATDTISLPRPVAVGEGEPPPSGWIVAEPHPLTDGLSWQGLLCRPVGNPAWRAEDQVLVWQGDTPVIVLRESGDRRQLVVAFDLLASNADRLPAFVVLLHRFVESVRRDIVAPEAANMEVNQRLEVAVDPAGGDIELRDANGVETVPASRARLLRSPYEPGWFDVFQGTNRLLRGAARFADSREADFTEAKRVLPGEERIGVIRRRNSRPDAWSSLWTLLLAGVLVGSWAFPGRRA